MSELDALIQRASYLTVDNGAPGEPFFEEDSIAAARSELRALVAERDGLRAENSELRTQLANGLGRLQDIHKLVGSLVTSDGFKKAAALALAPGEQNSTGGVDGQEL